MAVPQMSPMYWLIFPFFMTMVIIVFSVFTLNSEELENKEDSLEEFSIGSYEW